MNDANPTSAVCDTQTFLDLIHGPSALIYFQVDSKTWRNKPQTFRQAEKSLRWRNGEGDGICFVVNSGGTRNAQINGFNAVFLDWDSGRSDDGRYHEESVVRGKKNEFLARLKAFPVAPSIVVETRNGFHTYWLLHGGVSADQFRDCQRGLALALGGDTKVVNPARLMRLPGFNWVKPSYPVFPVRVISHSNVRYRIDDILKVMPSASGTDVRDKNELAKRHHNKCSGITTTALIVGTYRHDDQRDEGDDTGQQQQGREHETVFSTPREAIEYLKTRDLAKYLNLQIDPARATQSVVCPLHPDTTPSATITRDAGTNRWLYCCHSQQCGVHGTIIDVKMNQLNTDDSGVAVKQLMTDFNIRIDTGWKQRQRNVLKANVDILRDDERLRRDFPHLFRWIGRVRNDLITKLHHAIQHVTPTVRFNDQPVFFLSLREMERRSRGLHDLPRHFGRQSRRVDRYCALGLMRKLGNGELPRATLEEAKRQQDKHDREHRVQFYSIPEYTTEILDRADDRACKFIESGATVAGVSRQLVEDVLGDGVAAEVYPQRSRRGVRAGKAFAEAVEAVVVGQIERLGYTSTSLVISEMANTFEWKGVTKRRVQRVLPGVMKRRDLKKVVCTKQMKKSLNVSARGYPTVIVPTKPSSTPAPSDACATAVMREAGSGAKVPSSKPAHVAT